MSTPLNNVAADQKQTAKQDPFVQFVDSMLEWVKQVWSQDRSDAQATGRV